ncbi:MAG: cache domain-containing protein [Candidatus Aminicenantes bacterium]|nr:cache domain-containing protein [Candidatus Aminicenantes bacterium]
MNKPRFSLRTKLILTFLVVIVIGGLLTLFVGFRLIRNTLVSQAQAKVKHDLASAWMVFNGKLHEIQTVISLTAKRESLWDAIQNNRHDTLLRYLGRVRAESGLDILTLTDSRGRVISRTRNPGVQGDDQGSDEIVGQAIERGVVAAPQILVREELLKEGQDLADQASMEFVPTPKAAPRAENRETSGLVLKAAARVLDENQRLLGVLYGGVLLNRNYEIVDQIKGTVFKDEKYKGRETGTATIFQNDFRISTNVVNERGERAIGTLVSREVRQAVLEEGKPWIDRAFVVNDIYITAYEPIHNINGRIIGILYVGMLEKPYFDTADRVMLTFIGIAVLCIVFLLAILNFSTIRIIRPLEKMVTATKEIAAGDLSHRVEIESRDELGTLAESFNQMISQLKKANEELVMWAKTLEKKVQERTQELKDIQDHLLQAEKLASLGKLAAGIAHEINNPLGGVLIYAHLILEDLQEGSPHYRNLGKIVKETERCRNIVKGLLEFARPKEPEMILTDVNEVLETSVSLLERQALFQNITIKKVYAPHLARIVADGAQLQQVFMNIILNGAEAMEGNGLLTLKTYLDEPGGYLAVEISDTGRGIGDEDIKRLFEPFFTTKEAGKGTGLGLAISYGIIQKHSGSIDVESRVGEGTLFRIKLPLKREAAHD